MYYERIREQKQMQEKESDSDIEEQSLNQSSEELNQLTNNNERSQKIGITYENYPKKERDNYISKEIEKDYLSPYISKKNIDYNIENGNKENNYLSGNKNVASFSQKNFVYNENIVRKNETEIKNYHTEETDQNLSYPKINTIGKYEIKDTKNNQKVNNKEKTTKKLNFSYDENVNNFDNYNKLKNIRGKKELIKMEYNNFTFSEKIENDNTTNSKNLKFAYKINNKSDINLIPDNYSQKKTIYYIKEDKRLENNEKLNKNNFQRNVENKNNINSKNTFKEEKNSKTLIRQISNNSNGKKGRILEEEAMPKPDFFFSYDYSPNIKNYDNINLTKSELSTALDTAKYKNYQEEKNIEVKEFNISENGTPKVIINKKEEYSKNNYELNETQKNYINNLKTLNADINKEKAKANSLVNKYIDKNTTINNINEKDDLKDKLKYYNSTNNLIIHDMNENEKLSSLLKKNYSNIKIIDVPAENNDNSKQNKYNNSIHTNPHEDELQNNNITPQKREIEVPYSNNKDNRMTLDSNNLNTLESAVIRHMDEEEEIRTLELEKERKILDELEKEKEKLILEEQERRERIIMEIRRQEMLEIEKKQLMRKKYEEKMKKKKEDEEKLMKIKEEQQRQLREIYELKNNRKYDEQKLLLLTEGKLNKKQRSDYIMGITGKNFNLNKLPFRIDLNENNNEFLINKMKNNNIDKNSKYWNYKNNNINNEENNSVDISDENEDNYEENIIKDNNDFEEIENNSEEQEENKFQSINEIDDFSENKKYQENKDLESDIPKFNNKEVCKKIYKTKNRRMNINNNPLIQVNKNEKNEYKTFSPKINHKKNISILSPVNELDHSSKKLSTELPDNSSKKISKEKISVQSNEIKENDFTNEKNENNEEPIKKDYYTKKKFALNKKQINKEQNKFTDTKKSSFAKLNELREITSKLASEVEKKIQLINKNKLFSKAKSSPKLSETYTKFDYQQFQLNLDTESKENDEPNFDKEKNKTKKDIKDTMLAQKSYKYNQLIKDTKIEISNLINNNHEQISKKKSFIGDNNLPEEIKKECLSELRKMENFTKKKGKENIQLFTGKANKLLDNINRNKKIGIAKSYKTNNNFNQKVFYNDYLYGNKKKIQGQEIDQKFLPYYKEIYGETTPENYI